MPRPAPQIMQPHTDVTAAPVPEQVTVEPIVLPRRNLREAVEDVFWQLGGPDGMMAWTKESTANKRIFYKDILPKLIPKELRGELTGANGGPMKLVVAWEGDIPSQAPAGALLQAVTAIATEVIDD